MADVFISYSRRDSDFAQRLCAALQAAHHEVWIDTRDIPATAEWMNEIYAGIDACNAVIFVLSPDYVTSEVCALELQHAVASKKRLIPIVWRDVTPASVDLTLQRLNWISLRSQDDFEAGIATLVTALDTDLDFVRLGTRLYLRAREWETKGRNTSFLLRGAELQESERWLTEGVSKPETLTPLHGEYIAASERAATNRLRTLLSVTMVVVVIMGVLATAAVAQSRIAEAQRQQAVLQRAAAVAERTSAQADAFAAQSDSALLSNNVGLGLLLSVKAWQKDNTYTTRTALYAALQDNPHIDAVIQEPVPAPVKEQDIGVDGLAFSSDGKTLLDVNANRETHVTTWNLQTRRMSSAFPGPFIQNLIGWSFAASADGSRVATVGQDGIRVWNANEGTQIQQLTPDCLDPNGWSPDGAVQYLLPGCPLYGPVALDSHARYLFAVEQSTGHVLEWDLQTQQVVGEYVAPVQFQAPDTIPTLDQYPIALDPTGAYLAEGVCVRFNPNDRSLCAQPEIWIWSVVTGALISGPLQGHTDFVSSLAFSSNGRMLVSGGDDAGISLWDVASGNQIGSVLRSHTGAVTGVAFSPDGTLIASAGDTTVRLWGLSQSDGGGYNLYKAANPLTSFGNAMESVAFSPDGMHVAAGDVEGGVMLWNVHVGSVLSQRIDNDEYGDGGSARYSPNGNIIAIADLAADNVTLINASTHKLIRTLALPSQATPLAIAFSDDGGYVGALIGLRSQETNTALIWSSNTGALRYTVDLTDAATELTFGPHNLLATSSAPVAFSPDGTLMASATSTALWNLSAGGMALPVGNVTASPGETDLVRTQNLGVIFGFAGAYAPLGGFSPDSHRVATIETTQDPQSNTIIDCHLAMWSTQTLKQVGQPIDVGACASAAISKDWRYAAIGLPQGFTYIDMSTGQPVTQFISEPDVVQVFGATRPSYASDIAFGSTDTQIILGDDRGISVWDLAINDWLARACQIANRNFTVNEWNQYFPGQPYATVCPNQDPSPSLALSALTAANRARASKNSAAMVKAFASAEAYAVQTHDALLNDAVCWAGAMSGSTPAASVVLPACNRAIALAPDNGAYHDSRVAAETVAGQYNDILSDLNAFVSWAQGQAYYTQVLEGDPKVIGEPANSYLGERQFLLSSATEDLSSIPQALGSMDLSGEKWYTAYYADAPAPYGYSNV